MNRPPDQPGTAPARGQGGEFAHTPVMVDEVVAALAPAPAGWVVDATVGGGGHASAVLTDCPQFSVLGLDQDPDALAATRQRLAAQGDRIRLRHCRFDQLAEAVADERTEPVVGVLFDLGVSSPQFDRPERGFSYRSEGPLDMRMDPGATLTADEIVNHWSEREIARVLRVNGDERHATRIARSIVANRPITSTAMLAEIVRGAIPAATRRHGGHPAKRTFQALRIEVNDELGILADSIDQAIAALVPGGRIAVLSYHSGEDRIVKQRFRHASTGGCECPSDLPCGCGAVASLRLLRPADQTPSASEIARNPRAGSARLRAGEKLDLPGMAA